MMYLYPDEVDMGRFSDKMWYAREAPGNSSAEYGKRVVESYLENMRKILFP